MTEKQKLKLHNKLKQRKLGECWYYLEGHRVQLFVPYRSDGMNRVKHISIKLRTIRSWFV